jgi:ABC-type glycerol-3-phosphate transport system substrate-binding protein
VPEPTQPPAVEQTKIPAPSKNPEPTQKPGRTSVVFWHTQSGGNKSLLEQMAADFTKETGIIVRPEYVDGDPKLYQKIMAAIQTGNPPDMVVAHESRVNEYMEAGAVVELDQYINDPEIGLTKSDFNDIWPSYIETNQFPQYDSKMLSFPFIKNVLVMYYNKDLLKAAGYDGPPRTWDQFEEMCIAVTKNDVIGYEIHPDASTISGWIYSRGGALLDDDLRSVRFDERPGSDALQLIKDLIDVGAARQEATMYGDRQDFGAQQVFVTQKCAFTMGSAADRLYYEETIGGSTVAEGADFEWGIAMIPQIAGDREPATILYGDGVNIAIFKTTEEKQRACWQFIKWFAGKEQTARWTVGSDYMPVRKSAAETDEVKARLEKSSQYRQALEILPYSKPEPNIHGWQDARAFLKDALVAVMTGQKNPEVALDDAAKLANEAIQSRQ